MLSGKSVTTLPFIFVPSDGLSRSRTGASVVTVTDWLIEPTFREASTRAKGRYKA